MQSRLIRSALLAVLAAQLLNDGRAQQLRDAVAAGLAWAASQWPDLGLWGLAPLVQPMPTALAVVLLLLIPISWLKPH
jgi:hypothetical protein